MQGRGSLGEWNGKIESGKKFKFVQKPVMISVY